MNIPTTPHPINLLDRFENINGLIDTIDIEQQILSSCFVSPLCLSTAIGLLNPESFQVILHSMIFSELLKGDKDIFTIAETIWPENKEAKNYVLDLLLAGNNNPHWEFLITDYCEALRDKSYTNRLSKACYDVCSSVSANSRLSDLLPALKDEIIKTESEITSNTEKTYSEIVGDALSSFYDQVERKGLLGISTGFNSLDRSLSGLQGGKLYILAARPAMGKSALAGQLALNIASKNKKPVMFFSLEMSPQDIVSRLFSITSGVDLNTSSESDLHKLTNQAEFIDGLNLIIPDMVNVSIASISARITRDTMKYGGPSLIIVDYLQLMKPVDPKRVSTRQEEVAEFSRGLKQIAREYNCPVIGLSQLSRAVEGRQEKRPLMSDLRESGAIEQDADAVLFLYRDEYYNKNTDKPGIAEIIIGKNRSGPLGEIELLFSRYNTSFTERPIYGGY